MSAVSEATSLPFSGDLTIGMRGRDAGESAPLSMTTGVVEKCGLGGAAMIIIPQ
jgi:hypothetical protein